MNSVILVTGANGQVGRSIVGSAPSANVSVVGLTRDDLDITNSRMVAEAFAKYKPAVLINAAAYTAVDKAESDSIQAYTINETGPETLAQACERAKIPLLHISTDYVFNGLSDRPYTELDEVQPLGVYGRSKEAGEQAVRKSLTEHIILRTSWVYSHDGANFVKTMIRLGQDRAELSVVDDQVGGPTSSEGIAQVLMKIALQYLSGKSIEWGTYHYSGVPHVSWYEFAEEIFSQAHGIGLITGRPKVTPIPSSQFPTPVERPKNSSLSAEKIADKFNVAPEDWRQSLQQVLHNVLNAGQNT